MLTARRLQRTIAREAEVRGVGFFHGADVALRFRPAAADTGVVFVRTDLPEPPAVPAHIRHVIPRQRRTTLQQGEATVEMVEHVLAALAGPARRQLPASRSTPPRRPGCDGSSQAFVEALNAAGVVELDRAARDARHRPADHRPRGARDPHGPPRRRRRAWSSPTTSTTAGRRPIGAQSLFLDVSPESFRRRAGPEPDLPARGRGQRPAAGRDRLADDRGRPADLRHATA